MKKFAGPNATAEVKCPHIKEIYSQDPRKNTTLLFFLQSIKTKLLSICDEIGILKPMCRKFVKQHLGVLIEELTTTDDVRTICVRTKACK